MSEVNPMVHLFAGGLGGTIGAVCTCPLDVVKTRLQSSCAHWSMVSHNQLAVCPNTGLPLDPRKNLYNRMTLNSYSTGYPTSNSVRHSLVYCLQYIYRTEGVAGLFRGLGPNLVGVAPSRAIYFCAYAKSKDVYSRSMFLHDRNSMVHLLSAATAGFVCCTATNPIWFIKTRLQLDERHGVNRLTVMQCIRNVYRDLGIKGFYRGVTASYMGISETVVHFVIYEKLKELILRHQQTETSKHERSPLHFAEFLLASGFSKTIACVAFYPHEVARTRMREEGNAYRSFWQTLGKVTAEEGWHGLYRGLFTQLLRAIPNTAIMMSTYEIIVYMLSSGADDS